MNKLIVIGGSGYGQLIIEVARLCKWDVIGYTDPDATTADKASAPYLGADTALDRYPDAHLILGIGSVKASRLRSDIASRIACRDARWATLVHPGAHVSPCASLGAGAVILGGAIVNSHATIGRHAIVNSFSLIDHDVDVGDYTHVGPGAILGGGSKIGPHSMVGIHASIRDHVAIGANTTVAMGAVVTKDFEDGSSTLVGCPAAPFERSRPA